MAIPGYGVYGQSEALAQKAYDETMANLATQQSSFLRQYGFRKGANGQYEVDPYSTVGLYQTMRRGEAQNLDQARMHSVDRGIGTGGLGAQEEDQVKQDNASQDFNFSQDFQAQMQQFEMQRRQALNDRNAAFLQAEQDAMDAGLNNQDFTTVTPPPMPGTRKTPVAPTPKGVKYRRVNKKYYPVGGRL